MCVARSTFYDAPAVSLDDVEIAGRMQKICDEFEAYGYRRIGAELRHQGVVVNHKKIRRLMRENGLQPKRRHRYVATTAAITIARSSLIARAICSSTVRTSSG
jgi:putative transposase